MELDELIQLYSMAVEERGRAVVQPRQSEAEVEAMEEALSFRFPPSFRRFLFTCPYYAWRALMAENEVYHERDEDGFLPEPLILFMGGPDGDCICFDSRSRGEDGEVPVVYWDLENMNEGDIGTLQPLYSSFIGYLQFLTDYLIGRKHVKRP